ncbi:MAG TPA: hypothetical protein VGG19_13795 [Tepidisphaeraceae bacterium]
MANKAHRGKLKSVLAVPGSEIIYREMAMSFFVRQIIRAALSATLLITFSSAHMASATSGHTRTAAIFMEVRLRKIHLVRPDLIPYPISYEIDC